ncbi:MAG TPA: ferredoxin reductase [Gemmatimonadaceae bacterium]|nr:ferredoxin reductase [Gemmatimonadaceae bacterium]
MDETAATPTPPSLSLPIPWRVATLAEMIVETPRVRTLVLDVPAWPGHRAGQHVDVRLTAEDGYRTERSYSIASAPESARLSLTVERLEDGEVSMYLVDVLQVGDKLELRGPIGGHFAWSVKDGGPLMLVGGGSGIVPLMAMLRARANASAEVRRTIPARLLYSSRSWMELIYREELARLAAADDTLQVTHTITRDPPSEWQGLRRRIDTAMLEEISWPPSSRPHLFVCGPTGLVETAAQAFVALGHPPTTVRTERFGPTGGAT